MNSLSDLAFRLFRANKIIVASSIISIVVATTLALTMIMYTMGARSALESDFKKMFGEMDLAVGYNLEQDKWLSSGLISKIESTDGVEEISKVTIAHLTLNSLQSEIYTIGVESDNLSKSRYHYSKQLTENSAAINMGLAQALNVEVGDKIVIENREFKLVEIIADIAASADNPDMLLLDNNVVKEYANPNSEATYLLLKASGNTDILGLSNNIKSLDKQLRIDITEQDPFILSNINSLNIFIIVLSVLVIIVTALMIISNFEILLYKTRHQLSIMRSLGATTKQLSKIVIIQSTIINTTGVIVGLIISLLCNNLIFRIGEKIFSLPSSHEDISLLVGGLISFCCLLIFQLFSLIPIFRSAKILPLKIMEKNEELNFGFLKGRIITSRVLLFISLYLIVASQVFPNRDENGVYFLIIAALLILVCFFLTFNIYLTRLLNWILPFIQKTLGKESYISIKNIIPQVKKNTILILTIGSLMIITVFGSVMLNTIHKNEGDYLRSQFPTPIVVNSRLGYETRIDPKELSDRVEEIQHVNGTYTFSTSGLGELKVGDKFTSFNYLLSDFEKLQEKKLIPNLISKDFINTVLVSKEFAEEHNLKLGESLELGLYSNQKQEVESKGSYFIGGISDELKTGADMYMDWDNSVFNNENTVFEQLFVSSNNVSETTDLLGDIKKEYPEIKISTFKDSINESNKMFYQRWAIFIVVLIILVMSTTIGVFNSLINNILSKRKEFAILRTMGVRVSGIRKIILTQVTLYVCVGLLIGTIMGILLTLIISLIDPTQLAVNYSVIFLVFLVMLLLSLIVFSTLSKWIGKQKPTIELSIDNK